MTQSPSNPRAARVVLATSERGRVFDHQVEAHFEMEALRDDLFEVVQRLVASYARCGRASDELIAANRVLANATVEHEATVAA